MRKTGHDIPAAELDVLGALWRLGEGTVHDVRGELQKQGRQPAYTTVLTLLGRLEGRRYVHCQRGDVNVYRPRISREQVTAARLGTMVDQLADGEAMPLILQLVQAHRLSTDDIRQLRDLLGGLEREGTSRG
jgi:BlaI family penicillinase repressor